jgi:hypothetical protein
MRTVKRWVFPSFALLGITVAIAAAAVPGAAGDTAPAGKFVIGDASAIEGAQVTFWGAQWWKENEVSNDETRPSFKGYATNVDPTTCTFSTRTGNSPPPPDDPLPTTLEMLVTSGVTQSGSVISGTITAYAIVAIDPGYQDNPGHAGTGTVLDVVSCTPGGSGGGGDF